MAGTAMACRTFTDIRDELRTYQRRLGTTEERTDDLEHVLGLAHEINNRLSAEYLRAVVAAPRSAVPTLLAVSRRLVV